MSGCLWRCGVSCRNVRVFRLTHRPIPNSFQESTSEKTNQTTAMWVFLLDFVSPAQVVLGRDSPFHSPNPSILIHTKYPHFPRSLDITHALSTLSATLTDTASIQCGHSESGSSEMVMLGWTM